MCKCDPTLTNTSCLCSCCRGCYFLKYFSLSLRFLMLHLYPEIFLALYSTRGLIQHNIKAIFLHACRNSLISSCVFLIFPSSLFFFLYLFKINFMRYWCFLNQMHKVQCSFGGVCSLCDCVFIIFAGLLDFLHLGRDSLKLFPAWDIRAQSA